jgi:hypothetical protein
MEDLALEDFELFQACQQDGEIVRINRAYVCSSLFDPTS